MKVAGGVSVSVGNIDGNILRELISCRWSGVVRLANVCDALLSPKTVIHVYIGQTKYRTKVKYWWYFIVVIN